MLSANDAASMAVITAVRWHVLMEWFGAYAWWRLIAIGIEYWSYFSAAPHEEIVLNREPFGPLTIEEADQQRAKSK